MRVKAALPGWHRGRLRGPVVDMVAIACSCGRVVSRLDYAAPVVIAALLQPHTCSHPALDVICLVAFLKRSSLLYASSAHRSSYLSEADVESLKPFFSLSDEQSLSDRDLEKVRRQGRAAGRQASTKRDAALPWVGCS